MQHERLSARLLQVARSIRIRLATTAEDISQFQDIESGLVAWRRGVERGGQDAAAPRDEHGLTQDQTSWLGKFHQEGGHMSALSTDQIRHIVRHGMIAMMEVPIQSVSGTEVYLPVGTVSALSPAPCSVRSPLVQLGEQQSHVVFPNLDLHDLRLADDDMLQDVTDAAPRTLTDYRSSIRGPLSTDQLRGESLGPELLDRLGGSLPKEWEGWSPRKLGLAALGKMMCVLALGKDKELFTFNIGTVKSMKDKRVVGTNAPSLGHNSYARAWAWRGYKDVIIPQVLQVYWQAYVAEIDRVLQWGMGLLQAKGYDLSQVRRIGSELSDQIQERIGSDEHAPL